MRGSSRRINAPGAARLDFVRLTANRLLKNASRVKIEFCASRVSEGSVFLRPPIWGSQGGVAPFFHNSSTPPHPDLGHEAGRVTFVPESPLLRTAGPQENPTGASMRLSLRF